MIDFDTSDVTVLGTHEEPVKVFPSPLILFPHLLSLLSSFSSFLLSLLFLLSFFSSFFLLPFPQTLAHCPNHNLIISGSWDKVLSLFLPTSPLPPILTLPLPLPSASFLPSPSFPPFQTIATWDVRTSAKTASYATPERVYAMAVSGHRVVVGTARRDVLIYDLRMERNPPLEQDRGKGKGEGKGEGEGEKAGGV